MVMDDDIMIKVLHRDVYKELLHKALKSCISKDYQLTGLPGMWTSNGEKVCTCVGQTGDVSLAATMNASPFH